MIKYEIWLERKVNFLTIQNKGIKCSSKDRTITTHSLMSSGISRISILATSYGTGSSIFNSYPAFPIRNTPYRGCEEKTAKHTHIWEREKLLLNRDIPPENYYDISVVRKTDYESVNLSVQVTCMRKKGPIQGRIFLWFPSAICWNELAKNWFNNYNSA